MSGPRVLMTADTLGGVFTYAVDLAEALGQRGGSVALATMGAALSPEQRRIVASIRGLAVFESAYRLEWMDDPWDDIARAGEWLMKLEAELAPDVVHLNGYAHAALPLRAPSIVVAHSCVVSWFRAVLGREAPAAYDRYRLEVARGIAATTALVAPTQAMLEAAERHHGPARRARVIANASDPARFRPAPVKEPHVLALGRIWDQAKNIATLAAVAPRLPWRVRVGGSARVPGRPGRPGSAEGQEQGGEGTSEPAHLDALGVLSRDEAARVLSRAAIYALPTRYEPFGLSILEAALSECALVIGDIPSLREVWGEGHAARYVDPDDPEALEAALRSLIEAPALRAAMGERARAHALRYAPARMAEAYLALYAEVALRSPAPRRALHASPASPASPADARATEDPCA